MSESCKIGDLVWAKMKGFSPWPGKVANPQRSLAKPKAGKGGKNVLCIWFFGTNNFGWIEENNVKPYLEKKEENSKACKTVAFKDALAAIEDYIAKKEAGETQELDSILEEAAEDNDVGEAEGEASVADSSSVEETTEARKSSPAKKKVRQAKEIENGEGIKASSPKKMRRMSLAERKMHPKTVNHAPPRKGGFLLDRPTSVSRPDTEPLNVLDVSQTLKDKNITPS